MVCKEKDGDFYSKWLIKFIIQIWKAALFLIPLWSRCDCCLCVWDDKPDMRAHRERTWTFPRSHHNWWSWHFNPVTYLWSLSFQSLFLSLVCCCFVGGVDSWEPWTVPCVKSSPFFLVLVVQGLVIYLFFLKTYFWLDSDLEALREDSLHLLAICFWCFSLTSFLLLVKI